MKRLVFAIVLLLTLVCCDPVENVKNSELRESRQISSTCYYFNGMPEESIKSIDIFINTHKDLTPILVIGNEGAYGMSIGYFVFFKEKDDVEKD